MLSRLFKVSERGISLVEVLIVITIISIFLVVAIPPFQVLAQRQFSMEITQMHGDLVHFSTVGLSLNKYSFLKVVNPQTVQFILRSPQSTDEEVRKTISLSHGSLSPQSEVQQGGGFGFNLQGAPVDYPNGDELGYNNNSVMFEHQGTIARIEVSPSVGIVTLEIRSTTPP